jgi:hypothetical protein
MKFRFYSTMEVDIPKLDVAGATDRNGDKDLDGAARALDKLGDFCGTALASYYFIREELAARLSDHILEKKWDAADLNIKYTGFHGVRVMWPADLIAEEAKRQDRDKALMNRKSRRQLMKKKKKRETKGKYSFGRG